MTFKQLLKNILAIAKSLIIIISILISKYSYSQSSSIPDFPKLKAILVVGPQEDGTEAAIQKMKKIEEFLKEKKEIQVYPFYGHKAVWSDIVKKANGANFFIYAGHGTTLGKNGAVGGLCLDQYVHVSTMNEQLKLDKNALVIFKSVCYGAGSSASDIKEISLKEAIKRVNNYAKSFFDSGAGAYYANNFGSGVLNFLDVFFAGYTMKQCFEKTANSWCEIETQEKSAFSEDIKLGIASNNYGGTGTRITYINGKKKVEKFKSFKNYEVAYVAADNYTIKVLKGGLDTKSKL